MDIKNIINSYKSSNPIELASTPPSAWYTTPEIANLEQDSVFTNNWLIAARVEQFKQQGDYVATEIAGQPIVIVRSESIKAFYNVCRHHAAQVMKTGTGCARALTCPYHAWSYKLDGTLAATPKFAEVCNFDKSKNGLKEVRVEIWQQWVFICLNDNAAPLSEFLGDLVNQFEPLNIEKMNFHKRVSYEMNCNWKVYVDNYLDGGYHVPILHKGLNSALDGKLYKIEIKDKYCLQSCPTKKRDNEFSDVRTGTARYFWQYPNVMFNLYDGIMGIMIVEPISVDSCRVIFDYFFDDSNPKNTQEFKDNSVTIANKVQAEDSYVCESVQRGLASKGYDTGRLSVSKEAGEHLFHQLLHQDLSAAGTD
ncbi:aromatic ring-hydroxylating dioxygenase subunit alpha [Thalassotalea nanhaiensis]|uniref:Aromatic ring-hydroxylating dioxygenase subunit alpha n=1 Tax=Thalassotalea nanhaiensis TaxID=3065648 RepID=A0ABY9TED1_9GAMM|nr:aromatic ring-hydroxylating dioxygenase subunit alpha [Colwelliaceae bacterium SQ345]